MSKLNSETIELDEVSSRKKIIKNLSKFVYRKEARQVASLYVSMVLVIALGFGISIVNTRFLGPKRYGDLRFLFHLFTFASTVMTLGFFVSGSRLLAQRENEHIRDRLVGGILAIASIISLGVIASLFIFSFFVDDLFHPGLGKTIRLFSPLLFVFPLRMCLQNVMQGDNRIFELSIFRVAPHVLYLFGAITVIYFVPLSLTLALALQLGLSAVVVIAMICLLKPKCYRIRYSMSLVWKENSHYGFHVYLGSLASVATASLIGLLLGYFVDTIAVGFFSLALMVTIPLTFIPNAFGTTLFKTFANRTSIPINATVGAIVLSACALTVFLLLIDKIIVFAYSAEYKDVIPLAYIIATGCVFHGFGDFMNRFLGAHGKGKELRNGAFIVGVSIVAGCLVLVPMFGAMGAAITRLVAGVVYFGSMFYYYKINSIEAKRVIAND